MTRRSEPRPTLFVPIEIKVREFAPKLLIAALAARRGWRVYVGSKVAIAAAIRTHRAPSGVYFAKGGDRQQVLADAKRHCQRLVVQDEEIGPGMTPDEVRYAWRTRYTPQINALIDRVFTYSDEHREVLAGIWPDLADKAVVTGWPRFDLWQPGYRRADEAEARALRERHGDFVLFCSRFKVNTPEQRDRRIEMARAAYGQLPPETRDERLTCDDYGSKATERYDAYLRGVNVLRRIIDAPDLPKLIIRPHPSENPQAWRDAFAGHPNVEVIFESEVGPWILAARAMLHTASTTAVQAHAYEVAVGFLAEVGYPPDGAAETESYRVSTRLDDVASAQAFVRSSTPIRLALGPPESGPTGDPAVASRIVDELGRLTVTPAPPVALGALHNLGTRINAGYHRWKRSRWSPARLTPAFYGTNAQPKLPGGLPAVDARRILADLPVGAGVDLRSVRSSLLCITAISANTERATASPQRGPMRTKR